MKLKLTIRFYLTLLSNACDRNRELLIYLKKLIYNIIGTYYNTDVYHIILRNIHN